MEVKVAAGLNLKNFRITKFVDGRARYLHLPVSGDPPPFGFILNRDSSAPLGGDRNRPGPERRLGLKMRTFDVCFAPESGHSGGDLRLD